MYTVTIEADGNRAVQSVEVRGDPDLPVTVAQAETRVEFLLEVSAALERARDTLERLTRLRDDLRSQSGQEQRLQNVDRTLTRVQTAGRLLGGIASAFNGAGVRPGSMYPPTEEQLDALDRAITVFDEAESVTGN
jgi:hypothetical protein